MMEKMEKMEKGFIDLKEKPRRLNGPDVPSYPHIYLGKDKMKEVFKGAKIGEGYQAMIECTLDGDGLELRKIKLVGSKMMDDKGGESHGVEKHSGRDGESYPMGG